MQSDWLQQFMGKDSEVSRRTFMQGGLAAGVAAGAGVAGAQVAQAQTTAAPAGDTPIGPKWWPSRWGPQDEAGASNWITPEKVLAAAKLIKTGKIYNLDQVYEAGIPSS